MTASTPGAGSDLGHGPDPTRTPVIRAWAGDDEPGPRACLIGVRAGGTVAAQTMADSAPIRTAVARWPAE